MRFIGQSLVGESGAQGPQGPQGFQGSAGGQGPQGPAGTPNPTAEGLVSGNTYQMAGLGVGTSPVSGEIRAVGNIIGYATSDSALKTNLRRIESPLDKLKEIHGYSFEWTQEELDRRGGVDPVFVRKSDIGLIAQEVEKVQPEAVAIRPDGYKAVRYELLIPLLLECIHELYERGVTNAP
jgi:hypothetical protein